MSDLSSRIQTLVDGGIRPVTPSEIATQNNEAPAIPLNHLLVPRRNRKRIIWTTLAAAVSLAVILTLVLVDPPGKRVESIAPTPSHRASTNQATAALDSAGVHAGGLPAVAPGAGQSLTSSETFLVQGFLSDPNGTHFYYEVPGTAIWSLRPDGTGTERVSLGNPKFPTSSDEAAWSAVGSPQLVPTHEFSESLPVSQADSQAQAAQGGLGASPISPTVVPYTDLASLSTDPATLEEQLVSRYEGGQADTGETFELAANLLEQGAGPAQRSALFRMVASLPGITFEGPTATDVTDAPATGVSLTTGGVKSELLFDPRTSTVLEERNIVGSGWPTNLPTPTNSAASANPSPIGSQILLYTLFQSPTISSTEN